MTTTKKRFSLIRIIPILVLIIALILFFHFKLYHYLSFESLKKHRAFLIDYTQQHYILMMLIYIAIYTVMVAISVPGAAIMTIAGGFLFGVYLGTLYVIVSATLGAIIIFIAAKTAFAELLAAKAGPWVRKLEKGFQDNALSYLLTLRLIPIFPFWLINIVPAILNVRLRTFVIATFFGIIPGSLVYTALGNGVGELLKVGKTPDLGIVFQPSILLPLLGLAALSLLPVIYKKIKKRRGKNNDNTT